MALTNNQMELLNNNIVSRELIQTIFGNDDYYVSPLVYIEDELHLKLTCTGQEYRYAVECANDEDVAPSDVDLSVIVDGILAYIYADYLEAVGLDLVSYFTYRFYPPSKEFQEKLNSFDELINTCKMGVKA